MKLIDITHAHQFHNFNALEIRFSFSQLDCVMFTFFPINAYRVIYYVYIAIMTDMILWNFATHADCIVWNRPTTRTLLSQCRYHIRIHRLVKNAQLLIYLHGRLSWIGFNSRFCFKVFINYFDVKNIRERKIAACMCINLYCIIGQFI